MDGRGKGGGGNDEAPGDGGLLVVVGMGRDAFGLIRK
jgi:hypothetical protein